MPQPYLKQPSRDTHRVKLGESGKALSLLAQLELKNAFFLR